ncbi:MAG: hypothetical protein U1E27_05650, partial [Kiritimatiellia bacterium]|nr:hypothetical protein [Kiritimatiellia bacterium]
PSGGGEGGWAVTYWKDYKSMLDLVEAAVPNIDPENRIVGGYSSGGAAILELVARNKGDFQSYFHGFIPGGAGATAANAGSLRGRPVLFYCGDKDSRYPAMQSFYNAYSAAGVKAEFLTFKDIAHALPDSYFPEIRAWIMNKVVLRNLGDRVKQMNDRASSNQWIEALSLSASIRNLTAVDSPEYAAAESIRIRAETWGRQEATKWQAVGRSGPERRAFARNWRAYDFTAPLIRLCEEEGERELTALLDRNPTPPAALHRFLQDYNGFEVYRRGAMEFNVLGEKVLDGMLARSDVPPAQLAAFLQHWEGHPVEKKALEALNLQARFAHERFNRLPNPDVRQMREFIRVWSPSSYADEVKELLEQRAEEELKNILTIDNARMRAMRFQNFLRDFEGTEAARKASARK